MPISETNRKKIALVTGAAIRIGRGIAEHLLDQNYHIIVHAHTSAEILRQWLRINRAQSQLMGIIQADLSHDSGQNHLCQEVLSLTQHLDLIVHNASLYYPDPYEKISREAYRSMQAVNLDAPFFITQSLLPLLKKSDNPSVINILDAMWERPSPQYSHYAVGKAGLAMLTKSLARELAPKIRINAVAPGAILFQPFHDEQARLHTINKIPMQKLGLVNDIARAVSFLADEARYVTGEILVIDGGRSLV